MNNGIRILLLSLIFLTAGFMVKAQKDGYKWQTGINAGIMVYQGDLAPSALGSYRTACLTGSVYISRIIDPYFAIRGNLAIGSLYGNDALFDKPYWKKDRNFRFSTPVTEISSMIVWNPFGNNNNELNMRFTPYLMGGAGISLLNINRDYSRMNRVFFPSGSKIGQGLSLDSLHSLPNSLLVLPIGAGVSYYLSPQFSLTFETIFRYTFSDYLDGFSHAGNPNQKDYYHTHTLGLVYRFGKTNMLDCPIMKY